MQDRLAAATSVGSPTAAQVPLGRGGDADPPPAGPAPHRRAAGWRDLLLVCAACERRGKGPRKGTAKRIARNVRAARRDAGRAPPRVVATRCVGVCPKKACTVVGIVEGGRPVVLAMRRDDDAKAAAALLFGRAGPATATAIGDATAAPAPDYSSSTSSVPSAT